MRIYDIKSHHLFMQNLSHAHIIEQHYYFYIYCGHFEYFKWLKGGNMPPTWNCSLGPDR